MRATFSSADAKAYMKEPMLVDVTDLAKTMGDPEIKEILNSYPFFADKE